ncbi:MAG: hypothetical protein ACI3XM_00115 [Eubacteriales bacterium]
MKKLIGIILCVLTVLTLAACSEENREKDETENETGSYVLYEMTADGELFDNDFLTSVGFDLLYTLEVKEDGTGILMIDGEEMAITWKDGKVTIDGSGAVYTYQYADGKITLEETTGGTMVFQKTNSGKN